MIAETTAGKVRGKERGGIATWRGIPYATAPRFRPPGPVAPWTGERDAIEFGPFSYQSRDPRTAMMSGITEKTKFDEECLVLNVYAPLTPGKRPVLVWIHGGAFIMGAGSQPLYNGTSFVLEHDIVVVTLNYRLGMLGFMPVETANCGLLDQVAALRWVRDNIAAFGGDPNAVTIMGESAGAISVANLLAMPEARGLFHRAILQSGACSLMPRSSDEATPYVEEITAWLGVSRDELRTLPIDRLVAAQEHFTATRGLAAFAPCVDGTAIPRAPLDLIRDGSAANVPLLLGYNRDEWKFFDVLLGPQSTKLVVDTAYERFGPLADKLHAAYREARADHDAHAAWVEVVGDMGFRIPAIRLAEVQSKHAPVWMYRFDWATPMLGAAHALELPFVWNVVDSPFAQMLLGDANAIRPLAHTMHGAWAAFVRDGKPNLSWPTYDTTRRATYLFDREQSVVDDPGAALRTIWP